MKSSDFRLGRLSLSVALVVLGVVVIIASNYFVEINEKLHPGLLSTLSSWSESSQQLYTHHIWFHKVRNLEQEDDSVGRSGTIEIQFTQSKQQQQQEHPVAHNPDTLGGKDPIEGRGHANDPFVPEEDDPDGLEGDRPDGPDGPDGPEGDGQDTPEGNSSDEPIRYSPNGSEGDDPDGPEGDDPEGDDPDGSESLEGDEHDRRKRLPIDGPDGPDGPNGEGDDRDSDGSGGDGPDRHEGDDPDGPEEADPDGPGGDDPDGPDGGEPERDHPDGAEGDHPNGPGRDNPNEQERDEPNGREGDDPNVPDADDPYGPEGDIPDRPAGDDLDGPGGNDPHGREGDDLSGREGDDLSGREGDDAELQRGYDPDAREGDNPEIPKGDDPEAPEGEGPDFPEGEDREHQDVPDEDRPDASELLSTVVPLVDNSDSPEDALEEGDEGKDPDGGNGPVEGKKGDADDIDNDEEPPPALKLVTTTTVAKGVAAAATVPEILPEGRYTYQPRGQIIDESSKEELAGKWGQWTFVDKGGGGGGRPTDDYYKDYPNRDVPWNEFPPNAWQKDPEYLKEFLSQSKDLVERAMEVILSEYGFGKFDELVKDKTFEERRDLMFSMTIVDDMTTSAGKENPVDSMPTAPGQDGGWTTKRSFNGLVRRLLHAIATEDTFTMVTGGSSGAAGHGNHFQQSYTLQFHQIMEPVFARLGVKLISRNIGMGGLGTIQNAMSAGSIYGQEIDFLVWDSAMTEDRASDYELFARQGLISGRRVPVLWGGLKQAMYTLHQYIRADIGDYGHSTGNVPEVQSYDHVNTMPWAARYLKCRREVTDICRQNRYNGTCWIDREDNFQPPTRQNRVPGGRASWHPGNREHQLQSRVLAFTILRAIHEGLLLWMHNDGTDEDNNMFTLQDDQWHVTNHYNNIRSNIASLDNEIGNCKDFDGILPKAFCRIAMKGRTEFTPRANAPITSLRSIMKYPTTVDGEIIPLEVETNIYDPPDEYNPTLFPIPNGEVNYLNIIENGNDFVSILNPSHLPLTEMEMTTISAEENYKKEWEVRVLPVTGTNDNNANIEEYDIVPGLGWSMAQYKASPDLCDGSYDSFCGRGKDVDCLLYGHNDGRGALAFDSYSGWGIFTLRGVRHGVISIRLETWHGPDDNKKTIGWKSINNQGGEGELMGERKNKNLRRRFLGNNDKYRPIRQRKVNERNDNNHNMNYNGSRSAADGNNNGNIIGFDLKSNNTHLLALSDKRQYNRLLKARPLCDTFRFEWVINGTVYSLTRDEFEQANKQVQRLVEIVTLLDDPNFTNGEIMDVEIAIRMAHCQRMNVFFLSHIYWA